MFEVMHSCYFSKDNLIIFTSWNEGKSLLYDVDKKVWSWIAGCALQLYDNQGFAAALAVLKLERLKADKARNE
uniref:F-box/kelch-repeat protein At5g15710 n=1 Tax=Tanacetum cinerariifolium TaxID=118510 RepID=A0A699I426_TANCI|nr:F-box/kelch-repeat protein At5g15710 [Tanacetum cinerariifolium]